MILDSSVHWIEISVLDRSVKEIENIVFRSQFTLKRIKVALDRNVHWIGKKISLDY